MKTAKLLPKCLTKDEFEALDARTVIFWSSLLATLGDIKRNIGTRDYKEGQKVSGVFLTPTDAQTFQGLYEAGAIEFVDGTWTETEQVPDETQLKLENSEHRRIDSEIKNQNLSEDNARLRSDLREAKLLIGELMLEIVKLEKLRQQNVNHETASKEV